MRYDQLSAQDSHKLLSFVLEVSEAGDLFLDYTLSLLDELFGFRLTAYFIQDEPNKGSYSSYYVKSNSLSKLFLDQNQDQQFLEEGIAFWTAEKHTMSNQKARVFFSQDVKDEPFVNSRYLEFLHEKNIGCYAKLTIDRSPILGLVILKTMEEPPFSERERCLLQYIARFLKTMAQSNRKHYDDMSVLVSTDELLDSMEIGRIIITPKRRFSHYNSYYAMICREYNEQYSVDMFTRILLERAESEAGKPVRSMKEPYMFPLRQYFVRVETQILKGINDKEEYYILITVQEQSRKIKTLNPSAILRYHLSRREAEIAALMMGGKTYSQIASELYLSLPTVKFHIYNMFSKLEVNNKISAINKLKEG